MVHIINDIEPRKAIIMTHTRHQKAFSSESGSITHSHTMNHHLGIHELQTGQKDFKTKCLVNPCCKRFSSGGLGLLCNTSRRGSKVQKGENYENSRGGRGSSEGEADPRCPST